MADTSSFGLKGNNIANVQASSKDPAYFKTAVNQEAKMILTSQKFFYGPGRYRENQSYTPTCELMSKKEYDRFGRPILSNFNSIRVNLPYKKFVTLELFS